MTDAEARLVRNVIRELAEREGGDPPTRKEMDAWADYVAGWVFGYVGDEGCDERGLLAAAVERMEDSSISIEGMRASAQASAQAKEPRIVYGRLMKS